ncbi:MAG TPA: hypothetical protein VGM74_00585 [Burkholderiaceae bacterium]|jgi:cytosine/adenosine deaminase-related metal-dependent hydrolase
MHDFAIANVLLFDGSKNRPRHGALAVRDGLIAEVGDSAGHSLARRVPQIRRCVQNRFPTGETADGGEFLSPARCVQLAVVEAALIGRASSAAP